MATAQKRAFNQSSMQATNTYQTKGKAMTSFVGKSLVGAIALSLLGACASQPEKIQATYVSPSTYSSYSCKSIVAERNSVVNKVNELSGAQKKKATNDAVATGVALVLFWPAAFLVAAGSDLEPQIASLKGNYEALTAAGRQKGCFT
ncbi:hypothetical protein [Tateyamaria pelophila]|uniref:hypothetical protein n=1 Tax=Tateyamaria pelophila TaxID=328415 RepID=UPI001CC148ED|nr:hypothetical protein [Tateyamaria pelophila]